MEHLDLILGPFFRDLAIRSSDPDSAPKPRLRASELGEARASGFVRPSVDAVPVCFVDDEQRSVHLVLIQCTIKRRSAATNPPEPQKRGKNLRIRAYFGPIFQLNY